MKLKNTSLISISLVSYWKILQDSSKNLKNDENADRWAYILARRIEEVEEESEGCG